jgi:putative addiction module antidote
MTVKESIIRQIGNSQGATIPKSMLDRFHIQAGDKVHLIETEAGILISPFDPDFQEAMLLHREGTRKYRNALRELAR